jgi:phosphate transport system substrate-binding protein
VVFLENEKSQIGRAYANFLLTPQGQKLIAKTGFVPLD